MSHESEHTPDEGQTQSSHAAALAQELRDLAPPPPRPQTELLENYSGELPPEYHTDELSLPERESEEEFYGAGSEVTRHPVVDTESPVDTEANERLRELAKGDAITLIDGMTLELMSKVSNINGYRADLVDERRQIIRVLGTSVVDGLKTDPLLRDRAEARRKVEILMEGLISPRNRVEPSKEADEAIDKRMDDTRSFVSDEPQKITSDLRTGQMDAPKDQEYRWVGAVNKVTNLLDLVDKVDDAVRRDYSARLNEILLISDPNAAADRVELLSETGKVIVEMQRRLMAREGMLTDPAEFKKRLVTDTARWKGDYKAMAEKCQSFADTPPIAA